jgi:hypothetical protein
MKNAFLAILGVFAMSSALACGSAPPEPVQMEINICNTYNIVPEYVYVGAVTEFLVLPCKKQVSLFKSTTAVPITRPGFMYRNVCYENYDLVIDKPIAALDKNNCIQNYRFNLIKSDKQKNSDNVPRCLG